MSSAKPGVVESRWREVCGRRNGMAEQNLFLRKFETPVSRPSDRRRPNSLSTNASPQRPWLRPIANLAKPLTSPSCLLRFVSSSLKRACACGVPRRLQASCEPRRCLSRRFGQMAWGERREAWAPSGSRTLLSHASREALAHTPVSALSKSIRHMAQGMATLSLTFKTFFSKNLLF
jgi:hypothetical protein